MEIESTTQQKTGNPAITYSECYPHFSENEIKLLDIAKKFLEINPYMAITGTLMLKLRGIDLEREPQDIDLLINDWAPQTEIPKDLDLEEFEHASDGISLRFKTDDNFKIDIMSSNENFEIVNGLKLGSIELLMNAKYNYLKQGGEQGEKHKQDLIKLGFNFPKNEIGDFPI